MKNNHESSSQEDMYRQGTGQASLSISPSWIRLPKDKKLCPFTGLSRSKLNELVLPCLANRHRPPVKSVSLRKPGAIRGVRLIHLKSLTDYIEQMAQEASR